MRICLISREFPPETGWGGIGAYTYQHANALVELGHEVEVVALTTREKRGDVAITNGAALSGQYHIPVHRATWGELLEELSTIWISMPYSHYVLKTSLSLWSKFLELHRRNPFDVVEAPEHLAEGIFPSLTKVCPTVIRLHTPHFKFVAEGFHNLRRNFDQEFVGLLERTAMLSADVLSSPSEDLAQYVSRDCGLSNNVVNIVRNPVDAERFSPEGRRTIEHDGHFTVLFAGRLEERKGIYNLIDAVPEVVKIKSDVRFIIAGRDTETGPGGSSVLAELQSRLRRSGCTEFVRFVDHIPLSAMPEIYRSADVCVVPSLYDNASCTVLEAMACGKPVIGSSAGGTPEYVLHGRTGMIVPPGDTAALTHTIVELACDANRCVVLGAQARKAVLDAYERKLIARQAIETYVLAKERYDYNRRLGLYRKPPGEAFDDAVRLLYYYHQNLYQLIYLHSIRFRIKHWLQMIAKRPKLCLGYLVAEIGKPLAKISGVRQLTEATRRLEKFLDAKEMEKDLAFLNSLRSAGEHANVR